MWLWGGMFYIWMMSLIFYRYTFFPLFAGDLSPPYWINMGAMAISTLAGSLLILNAPDAPFLLSLLPFIKGFTVFYWATGTWWIPMLLSRGLAARRDWRFPLRYDPLYWGAVFPLGMYAACTERMMDAMSFDFLGFLPQGISGHRRGRVDGDIYRVCRRPPAPHRRISELGVRGPPACRSTNHATARCGICDPEARSARESSMPIYGDVCRRGFSHCEQVQRRGNAAANQIEPSDGCRQAGT